MDRRDFLVATSSAAALAACGANALPPLPPGVLTGANEVLGHRLRQPDFPAPTETRKVSVAIVGGGIGGLSAAWKLARSGCDDFLLLEMEREAGGNSRSATNEVSAYPLGAHYLPLPPREARATRALLAELGVLQGDPDAAHPTYDEKYLCHAPQERLYTSGYWQDGLWPTLGVPAAERAHYARFQDFIGELRQRRDGAGRRPFALPLALSSREPQLRALDRTTMRDWLLAQGYTAPGLHWLADYACRDDYGTSAAQTSAWAGLHYFACRDGDGQVLTAPEGNAWLARGLARAAAGRVQQNALVFRVEQRKTDTVCDVYLAAESRSIRIISRELIWAAPLFLLPRVFANPPPQWLEALRGAEYAPWIVANLTLKEAPGTRAGQPLAWDNVLHDSAALGYVVATHQALRYAPGPTVITWYRALHEESASRGRRLLLDRAGWANEVLADLSRPHPEIRELVTRIDVHRHAHAMIRPLPGRLWGGHRTPFEQGRAGVQFAHADVSGLSLFEEANYRGVLAAERTLRRLGVSFASSL
ncbi:MAG: NAD(P)/FAD-dependent oxidoreductase [Rhodocyclales bacterium]|nr:NAD(P)/FAD-dependent oxidoreductase [Rhodocyclales bacterium]